jgi:hypothetical protein
MIRSIRLLACVAILTTPTVLLAQAPASQPFDPGSVIDKQVPELRLDNSPLGDVMDFLRDAFGANIFVNWRALEGVGIDRTTPVSVRVRGVSFAKALRLILDDVGGGNVNLDYVLDEGVITISTDEDLAPRLERQRVDRGGHSTTPGEYYIAGVERRGLYSLNPLGPIGLRQALISAGLVDAAGKVVLLVRRDDASGANRSMTLVLRPGLPGGAGTNTPLCAGDWSW